MDLAPVPLGRTGGAEVLPFLASPAMFLFGYLGLVISNYPSTVPPTLTMWDTAAVPTSRIFMLIRALILLPMSSPIS